MVKIKILDKCTHCNDAAQLPCGEEEDNRGERYTLYRRCPVYNGSGNEGHYIGLVELSVLLEEVRCQHENTSYRVGYHLNGDDIWDDLEEVCDDCSFNLDSQ